MTKTSRPGSLKTAEAFGRLIRQRRRDRGMTQRDLALTIDSGERFVVDLEQGKKTCQLGKALQAAAAVGIRLGDLADTDRDGGDDTGYGALFDKP